MTDQPPIRVSRNVDMFEHHGDPPPCVCPGMSLQEGRGRGGAWVRFLCHHCGRESDWAKVTGNDSAQTAILLGGTDHTQTCWARPREVARA